LAAERGGNAGYSAAQGHDRAAPRQIRAMLQAQVTLDNHFELAAWLGFAEGFSKPGLGFVEPLDYRLRQQLLFIAEVLVKASVGQFELAHQVRDAWALGTLLADVSRRCPNDPLAGLLLVVRRVPHSLDYIHHLLARCQYRRGIYLSPSTSPGLFP